MTFVFTRLNNDPKEIERVIASQIEEEIKEMEDISAATIFQQDLLKKSIEECDQLCREISEFNRKRHASGDELTSLQEEYRKFKAESDEEQDAYKAKRMEEQAYIQAIDEKKEVLKVRFELMRETHTILQQKMDSMENVHQAAPVIAEKESLLKTLAATTSTSEREREQEEEATPLGYALWGGNPFI